MSEPDTTVGTPQLAGFVPRALAHALDFLILLPLYTLSMWARTMALPVALSVAFLYSLCAIGYRVGFIALRGATPGKRALGLLVARPGGHTVGWRGAVWRESVNIAFGLATWVSTVLVAASIDPTLYGAVGYSAAMSEASPQWRYVLSAIAAGWLILDAVVLLANKQKRAIHDYIAGTVVVKSGPPA